MACTTEPDRLDDNEHSRLVAAARPFRVKAPLAVVAAIFGPTLFASSRAAAQDANTRTAAAVAAGTDIGPRLNSGDSLRAGEYLSSSNGRYVALNRAEDSLLVVFDRIDDIGIWSTGVFGDPGGRVLMRVDGMLVEYRAGEEIWESGTVAPEAVAIMQNNGLLVIYSKEGPIWANGQMLGDTPAPPTNPNPPIQPGPRPTEPVGIEETVVVRGIRVHTSIANQVINLVDAATADGVALSGWGWRDTERQIELRRRHCGTSDYAIYEMPSSQCSPPTARPGRSMHERGLAIDFRYNEGGITNRSNPGYRWLAANASQYGLANLPSEPWHWSTNGR